ncbi:MAG TPA: ABC transporter ATP-binding protein [Acidothermales bacterium]
MTAATAEPVISVRDLRKTYKTKDGPVHAVDGLDLDVHHGEVFALLGPNGAGKTTTVEILEAYRKRNSGEVSVLGHDPAHPTAAWRQRIGIVLQTNNDLSELTVEEVVRLFTTFYATPSDPLEVIDRVGLGEKRRTRSRGLSGGQRRRLDVALGILGQPELLFLDEPTTGFDPEARREFWGLIENLADTGTTIMLTTHYLDEAEHLADRVAVIARGRIVALDTPAHLGGRDTADATVRWQDNGEMREVRTSTPTKVVSELAARFDGEIPSLVVTRPSLEDTYLRLIGEQPS